MRGREKREVREARETREERLPERVAAEGKKERQTMEVQMSV